MAKTLEEQLNEEATKIANKAAELWIEITAEKDIEYSIVEDGREDHITLKPKDENAALEKHYGSATTGTIAEFWIIKAKAELLKRLSNAKD
jgi:hypothetical protein